MLVLTRSVGQFIVCQCPDGTTIRLVVTRIQPDRRSNRVSIGIEAPEQVTILREELLDPQRGQPKAPDRS
jgi:carbon storage regulator CsrA